MTPYIGNGHYCYANVTAMLLASIGERVAPDLIEVLTGMAVGAHWTADGSAIFFDSSTPDRGITDALRLLGFEAEEHVSTPADAPPWGELAVALAAGPAILGPVDIGLLTHVPGRGRASGSDHYVLAYEMNEAEVFFHDPGGYPHVSLSYAALAEAWRAEKVGRRDEAFRWWAAPRRVAQPTDAEIFQNALSLFVRNYQQTEARAVAGTSGGTGGKDGDGRASTAILKLADQVRSGELPARLLGHLCAFALPVAARRALDFAVFLDGRMPGIAALKWEQASLFGRSHTLLVRQDWNDAADTLVRLATAEDAFRDQLMAAQAEQLFGD